MPFGQGCSTNPTVQRRGRARTAARGEKGAAAASETSPGWGWSKVAQPSPLLLGKQRGFWGQLAPHTLPPRAETPRRKRCAHGANARSWQRVRGSSPTRCPPYLLRPAAGRSFSKPPILPLFHHAQAGRQRAPKLEDPSWVLGACQHRGGRRRRGRAPARARTRPRRSTRSCQQHVGVHDTFGHARERTDSLTTGQKKAPPVSPRPPACSFLPSLRPALPRGRGAGHLQLLRKSSTANPSVEVARRMRQMLQGIMK